MNQQIHLKNTKHPIHDPYAFWAINFHLRKLMEQCFNESRANSNLSRVFVIMKDIKSMAEKRVRSFKKKAATPHLKQMFTTDAKPQGALTLMTVRAN